MESLLFGALCVAAFHFLIKRFPLLSPLHAHPDRLAVAAGYPGYDFNSIRELEQLTN